MAIEKETKPPGHPHAAAAAMPATGAWALKRRLAADMRNVIELMVASEPAEEELERAAAALEILAYHLENQPKRTTLWGFAESANAGDVHAFFDRSPLIGHSNPLAPPLALEVRGERVHGTVRFGSAYEGPPGSLHGGFVAAAFDEVLGFAQSLGGNPGMTATLTVRYRKPTPLDTDLRFDAGVDRVDGRKTYASGKLYAGDTLLAEGEGLFIAVDVERFKALLEEAEQRAKDAG